MILFFTIVFALAIGSFLNVCIYRMPQEKSVVMPRSFCPKCKHIIPIYDNIPILSFIVLGGKCRFCKERISVRYLIVELLTALTFVTLVTQLGLSITTIIYIILSCGLIVATFIDFEHQIIPDEITYGGMVLGLIASVAFPQLHDTANRLHALFFSFIGLLTGGAIIYLTGVAGKLIFKKDAMGGGDVKFLAMIGAFLGFSNAIFIYFLAPFFGSVVGIIAKIKFKADIIPYGPYLSLATFIVIIWGDKIMRILFPYL
ncbi:prepilin peptidase [Candidatus Omnitrophota bacterium]